MKNSRFLTTLLALTLGCGLLLPTAALAVEDLPEEPEIAATAWLLMDGDHNEVLLEQNAHEKRYPASITKVMTALLTVEAIDQGKLSLSTLITATEEMEQDLSIYGSTQGIKVGETMTVNDLLHCLLITSANEAANILAVAVAGSLDAFVAQMNAKAQALGCKDTNFANCHGLHDENHYTTAHDIYLFSLEAMKNPTFREIVNLKGYTVPATNLSPERNLHSTNALISNFNLLGYLYRYAIGIKTGSTPEAGQCLVSAAEQDGRTLYAVVLGAENIKLEDGNYRREAFTESKRLLEWGYQNTERKILLDASFFAGTVPVRLSREADYVGLEAEGTLEATLNKALDPAQFQREIKLNAESADAPVQKGQVMGSVTVRYEGKEYGTLPLVAVASVERSELLYRLDQIGRFFEQLWVRIALVMLGVLVLVLVLRWLLLSKRRRYGARGTGRRRGYSGRKRG